MVDELKVARTIDASPSQCHDLVADIESYALWVNDLREVNIISRDAQDRPNEVAFRAAAMGRSATYTLAYDHSESPNAISWQLLSGDIVKKLDGCYRFLPLDDDEGKTQVIYELAVELAIPLPGFVKRRAEGRIMHAALDDLQARLEK